VFVFFWGFSLRAAGVSGLPRGDPPGFVVVEDEHRLLMPDRPGNNRVDSFRNLVVNPKIGMLFFVPGHQYSLRINGEAHLLTDTALRERFAVNGKPARAVVEVTARQVFDKLNSDNEALAEMVLGDDHGWTLLLRRGRIKVSRIDGGIPAMQKLVERHKDDKNVAFLFVDTWESADDKKQIVADFVKKSPYTFHVLLDNDNKVVEAYKVSGIPTKFVIDKNGVTRFMAVGFDGNTDNTVDEIESMIAVTSTF